MTLTVDLTDEIRIKLEEKARALGMDSSTYIQRVLQADAMLPPLDEVLRPAREKFQQSGLTEDGLAEQYEQEKHAARAAKRGISFRE